MELTKLSFHSDADESEEWIALVVKGTVEAPADHQAPTAPIAAFDIFPLYVRVPPMAAFGTKMRSD
jgi:hypothetical protein